MTRAARCRRSDLPRFLIEVPHGAQPRARAQTVELLPRTGSHHPARADFGSLTGDHRAWIVVEGAVKLEVRNVLPPAVRAPAHKVGLNTLSLREVEGLLEHHAG